MQTNQLFWIEMSDMNQVPKYKVTFPFPNWFFFSFELKHASIQRGENRGVLLYRPLQSAVCKLCSL